MGSNMYSDYFGIRENAFSITPDPRFLFKSEHHCEALAHLLYGVVESGCFVMLTGEVGTGKTTICRTLLEQLPENVDVALLLNPPQSGRELLLAIHDELHIYLSHRDATLHELVYELTRRLLENHSAGRRTVVIIDEAQNIASDVLEQVRLLTNLETRTEKLLHVFLVGQPELRELLTQPSLRQVAQRITARYHLEPLTAEETRDYICHRLSVAGCRQGLFSDAALNQIYRESRGIPRVINILCDRALLGAFASDQPHVSSRQIRQAARQWRGEQRSRPFWLRYRFYLPVVTAGLLGSAALVSAYVGDWPGDMAAQTVRAVISHKETASPAVTEEKPEIAVQPAATPPDRALQQPPTASSPSDQPSAGQPSVTKSETSQVSGETTDILNRTSEERIGQSNSTGAMPVHKLSPLPDGIEVIGPNSPPEAVRWLRRELDRIDGKVSRDDSPLFDERLRKRVMVLQRKHGLVADGLAGPNTLHYLNEIYGTPLTPLRSGSSQS